MDAATLDSEGRCLVLEFPAFVLLGVYSPANRDQTRDDFRLGFLNALDARIRNLVAQGKRVVLTGDLNISREELDTANAEGSMRKNGLAGEEYASTPARRLFNQLLVGGKVFGERDEGREKPVLWDICRGFHPMRKGMFTCWEQKINARPGNYGARIDYVLCSEDMKDWFCDSNIQEGLLVNSPLAPAARVRKANIHGGLRPLPGLRNTEGQDPTKRGRGQCTRRDEPCWHVQRWQATTGVLYEGSTALVWQADTRIRSTKKHQRHVLSQTFCSSDTNHRVAVLAAAERYHICRCDATTLNHFTGNCRTAIGIQSGDLASSATAVVSEASFPCSTSKSCEDQQ